MATATPVVATAWGGPADYLNTSCGILIDPSNAAVITQGFIDAMRKLIADPELRMSLGKAGRQRVEELFDWNQKIDWILKIYQQAIDEHRS
jgi:glycosyltransferase involved in cell wall biosynthesis